jgi:hypothetical protein
MSNRPGHNGRRAFKMGEVERDSMMLQGVQERKTDSASGNPENVFYATIGNLFCQRFEFFHKIYESKF